MDGQKDSQDKGGGMEGVAEGGESPVLRLLFLLVDDCGLNERCVVSALNAMFRCNLSNQVGTSIIQHIMNGSICSVK